eukprot:CAMPEP_0194286694 /NCGR_PEP_ID=MMETSP0169-20130528/33066_1 /TAXON_ID=218684 /ORGANISM="Corethron pennatum, Strain L29A3" /LENGTH=348 /DNA_ID=CAMNT_0039033197 /DNA_START=126 /DNA_END=1169 /DNA_ORIENTATION=+
MTPYGAAFPKKMHPARRPYEPAPESRDLHPRGRASLYAKKWTNQTSRLFLFVNAGAGRTADGVAAVRGHLSAMRAAASLAAEGDGGLTASSSVDSPPPRFDGDLWKAMRQPPDRGVGVAGGGVVRGESGRNPFSLINRDGRGHDTSERHRECASRVDLVAEVSFDRSHDLQWRYLAIELQVYEGEYYVREAELLAKSGIWRACAVTAEAGKGKINAALVRIDAWYAVCLYAGLDRPRDDAKDENEDEVIYEDGGEDENEGLSDDDAIDSSGHDLGQIQVLSKCAHMSSNHANNFLQTILHACERRRAALMAKLVPQWQSRDEVKERMGEQRWKENPNPKHTFAEMRRQ